ncbi:class I SAM-dependent methyltransferase [Methylobacterium sp. E-045]|uniref:class I SAM-dependent methyltransferase n=1 Tax=Methylobacterium sp. E-045 TaxID=2836575 RepID=UPI001FBAD288|nr:class I SAM-dependent methyltransferase [Methylobacterium sp. E-045]MCJ2131719.1 class I SAM-dependent methyltransferase [Methylobacterium sp. E-045]
MRNLLLKAAERVLTGTISPQRVSFPADSAGMDFTGERYVPGVAGQIKFEHLHRYLLSVEYAHHRDVLDIASGEGYGTASLASVAKRVVGVDISMEAVAHANRRYGSENLSFKHGSIATIPADDKSFDLVVCFETLEHIGDQAKALAELRRVLRPDGLLIISTPNIAAEDGALHEANPFHEKELTEEELRALIMPQFQNYVFYEQRFTHGSIIATQDSGSSGMQLVTSVKENVYDVTNTDLGKNYFIVLASNSPLPPLNRVSLFDGSQELKSLHKDFTYAVSTMHSLEAENAELKAQIARLQTNVDLHRIQIDFLRKKLKLSVTNVGS